MGLALALDGPVHERFNYGQGSDQEKGERQRPRDEDSVVAPADLQRPAEVLFRLWPENHAYHTWRDREAEAAHRA